MKRCSLDQIRRTKVAALFGVVVLLVLLARPVHTEVVALLRAAVPVIQGHPVLGPLVFVLLAALSAALAFFSSAVFVPVAVDAWGYTPTIALLCLGWWIGGVAAYALGRYVGDPVVRRLVGGEVVDRYERWIRARVTLGRVVLLHMAVPSEAASYLLGMARAPWGTFIAAIGIAQLPFAVLSALLGASFLERRIVTLVVLGAANILLSVVALRVLHRAAPAPPQDPA